MYVLRINLMSSALFCHSMPSDRPPSIARFPDFQKCRFSAFCLPCPPPPRCPTGENWHRPKKWPKSDSLSCRMGAVIPAPKRVRVGQFLGQGESLWRRFPPPKVPENENCGVEATGATGFLGNLWAVQFSTLVYRQTYRCVEAEIQTKPPMPFIILLTPQLLRWGLYHFG